MSSKRHQRKKACENKKAYSEEESHLAYYRYKKEHPDVLNVSRYKCKFCGKWHVGRQKRDRLIHVRRKTWDRL